MMMGKKGIDGHYYLTGYVASSPRQRNVYIEFMIDTSQRISTISKADAERNDVKLESLEIAKG
jgi:predicted aspartyl protease